MRKLVICTRHDAMGDKSGGIFGEVLEGLKGLWENIGQFEGFMMSLVFFR